MIACIALDSNLIAFLVLVVYCLAWVLILRSAS